MGNRVLQASFVAGLALLTGGCGQSKPVAASAPATAQAAATPATPAADETFIASGPLVVENQVDVAAEREGLVYRIFAEPGTKVRRGQLLAQLDDRQVAAEREAAEAKVQAIQANLKNWEAEVQVLKADLERAEKMWEAQLITKQQLDHDRYKVVADQYEVERERQELRLAEARLRALDLELQKTRIKAPFDGLVARRYVRAGQKVALGDRLFWVTVVSPLQVKFTLPEQFMGRVKRREELIVTSLSAAGEERKVRVTEVSPVVDPASGTIEVVAELVGPAGELRPGMTVNIHIDKRR
ncbi:MAG TPA: efflux RND transporter periplasmic adaptor subunit [Terriglobales bacterium]|jgi:RND family efflux transporter MFP subunit|nr:efflux RND transporter periplasmic adaptor subunit [Terriglobales bacterium]